MVDPGRVESRVFQRPVDGGAHAAEIGGDPCIELGPCHRPVDRQIRMGKAQHGTVGVRQGGLDLRHGLIEGKSLLVLDQRDLSMQPLRVLRGPRQLGKLA